MIPTSIHQSTKVLLCLYFLLPFARSEQEDLLQNQSTSCKTFFNNNLINTCETYQIATLNSNPQRCLYIQGKESSPIQPEKQVCTDFPGWFDGTNGCKEYAEQDDWCELYGKYVYQTNPHTAQQACCACGGGNRLPPRFQVGDYVRVAKMPEDCNALRVKKLNPKNGVIYTVEVMKSCGKHLRQLTMRGVVSKREFEAGSELHIRADKPGAIDEYVRIEMRKCRSVKEQEFIFDFIDDARSEKNHSGIFNIHHPLSKHNVSVTIGTNLALPSIIEQVFHSDGDNEDDELFEGSQDYFFIASTLRSNSESGGRILVSGAFGQTEYENAIWQRSSPSVYEVPSSMWTVKRIDSSNVTDEALDEHAMLLEKIAETTGIENLERLPPWHLLDVERFASKSEVKSRFRELSRSFHPDKVHPSHKIVAEQIFVLLQNAYEGLKNTNEKERDAFRAEADAETQLFSNVRHVVELLPLHWKKVGKGNEPDVDNDDNANVRYVINAASQMNSTKENAIRVEDGSAQVWLIFLYSARCGMSRAITGFLDLAARHLEKHENIKVGAYGCGLYSPDKKDVLGVTTDPICKQFHRTETPNVHILVETLEGSEEFFERNADFKHFNAAVPHGNSTHLYPHQLIEFARRGRKLWNDNDFVRRMKRNDFRDTTFITNTSVVAFFDATGYDDDKSMIEIQDAISSTMPTLARIFLNNLYVGIALCGSGNEEDERFVDCSDFGVSWLPDVKIFGPNQSEGLSLIRSSFVDRRDAQIAMETMTNILSTMLNVNGAEDFFDEESDESDQQEFDEEGTMTGDGTCGQTSGFNGHSFSHDLDEIDGVDRTTLGAPESKFEGSYTEKEKTVPPPHNKPKLAEQPQEKHSRFDARKTLHQRRQGTLLGGPLGVGGAIASG